MAVSLTNQQQQPQYGTMQPMPAPKVAPAPGTSPVGGTTGLPQYLAPNATATKIGGAMMNATSPQRPTGLQTGLVNPGSSTPNNPFNHPVAGATQQPGGVTPPPPVPASVPAGAVPPPPPAAPPQPPAPPAAPGADGPPVDPEAERKNKEMHDTLWQKLMDSLNNPSRYGEALNAQRIIGTNKLKDEATLSRDRVRDDAMSRGVYYGTPLTNSLGNVEERYNRGLADMEGGLQADYAKNYQQDRLSAIQSLMQYGQLQQNGTQMDNDLWIRLMELANQGAPQMPSPSYNMPTAG